MPDTNRQFDEAIAACRAVFVPKLRDYGASWRIMRPATVTDQIFIKAKRIRTLETEADAPRINEGILPEFMAIVNYAIVGIIQLKKGYADDKDLSAEQAIKLYDEEASEAKALMAAKNHDYGEAWRAMRVTSYTDFILTKISRIKEIEGNGGRTSVSEGIASNYQDILNYAVFAIIRLTE